MRKVKITPTVLIFLLLTTSCVTINVYFPAAAAESAADILIRDVYGIDQQEKNQSEPPQKGEETGSMLQWERNVTSVFLNAIIPSAYAQQPDINISSPGINKLQSLMKARHKSLSAYYDSGAVGMENNGLISVRDAKAIPLKQRNEVKKFVADENRDRNALYAEIARANGHPEWEAEIRKTFARRWIGNAPSGWWHKGVGGAWQQK
ncbi:MAG: YdbL family protein [Gammaproteobacteria bacterium]